MDFARKQLEKYGWKDGDGLGRAGNEGITVPLKAKYKSGKEGMGFDLAKDLVDPWWENAYNESLKRVNVHLQTTVESNKRRKKTSSLSSTKESESESTVVLSMNTDGDDEGENGSPAAKIMKRMIRSNFTDFSKGATLTNGRMEDEKMEMSTQNEVEQPERSSTSSKKQLTDDELLKACGGRTCHKAARFGYRLNGKLARLAAQDELELNKLNAGKVKQNERSS